ncbi:DUF4386 domain-containing protein [Kordia sp. YSTF-M3]|uniref:DUF4386 domain-containing protein n=1 Tax=Kordia aestuariivivens TaxID=2759037 RepID=A0ABR7Q9A2_9FLAO|nr:DUF4386 domain-containing protein [Kordia aestuariivivens]MBC8755068.1 DUF4386 domain-containing protein [Kordia aestuariivivens]
MNSNKKTARIVGILFLLIFAIGVTMYQFLQSSLFADDFLTATAANGNQIIISTLFGIISGVLSITIAILLLPIFKRHNYNLAFIYVAFSILGFVAIFVDNISVLSLLDLSNVYVESGNSTSDSLHLMGTLLYERHSWTHYFSLLISCFPVFFLYYALYVSKLIPRVISIFGIVAVLLMFTEIVFSIFGNGISMNMMMPMGLVQLLLPIWLLIKGFNSQEEAK